MRNALFALISLLVSIPSYGFLPQVSGDSKITDVVNANFYCISSSESNPKAKLMLAFDLALEKERVWQVENESDEKGLELSVLRFERARCPLTYSLDVQLQFMGEKVKYSIETSSESCPLSETAIGKLSAVYADGNDFSLDLKCHSRK